MSKPDLDKLVQQFSRAYRSGFGVKSVSKTSHGTIKVVVDSLDSAGKVPATFGGIAIEVVQDLGPPLGERAIIRDASGKVVGAQG